jgi:uncharacterized protein
MWKELWVALALLFIIEGVLPFINPAGLRRTLIVISQLSDEQLRWIGLSSMVLGVILLYVVN